MPTAELRPSPWVARFLPLIATLLIFLVSANLLSLIPGLEPPTAKLETDGALALIVFGAVHWYGIRIRGVRGYLREFTRPAWIMLPLNVLAEFTRTFSMMVRLFGNIMAGVFVVGIVLSLAGLFVPIPLMALDMLTGIVQAYIFTVLAMVFIGAAIGNHPTA
jgi:F-type H+-transporting ATPase subunit a